MPARTPPLPTSCRTPARRPARGAALRARWLGRWLGGGLLALGASTSLWAAAAPAPPPAEPLPVSLPATATAVAHAPSDDPARVALHARADALGLADDPGWQALLHREPGVDHSSVQDAWFFASPVGRQDARAELHASLDALVDDPTVPVRDEPFACLFGARQAFFAAHLGADFTRLAAHPGCPRRAEWLAGLDARRVWLVFPDGYLNSPSSMFGHTLLRVDSAESDARGPLLSYAINFIAETNESNGAVFAIRGLTGGYPGRYSVLPYYEKVREYTRMESRDLWEYPLDLTDDERDRLLLHVWELRGASFTYYFLSKNCAYQVLALLQTVRPDRDRLSGFSVWAIPSDTLRELADEGWLGAPVYRPALDTRLKARAAQLPPAARTEAVAISDGQQAPPTAAQITALPASDAATPTRDTGASIPDPAPPGSPRQQVARTLDVAHDRLYSSYISRGSRDRDAQLARARAILAARAATGVPSRWPEVPVPAVPPDDGHPTQRVTAGGFAQRSANGPLLSWQPAYHDLLDPPGGFTDGSAISFLGTRAAYDTEHAHLRLDDFRLLEITSLATRDAVLAPVSWRLGLGARREEARDTPLRAFIEGGPGLAWGRPTLRGYGFASFTTEAGRQLAHDYDVRAGVALGTLWQPTPRLRARAEAGWQAGVLGARRRLWQGLLESQFDVSRVWAVRGRVVAERFTARGDGLGSTRGAGADIGGRLELVRYLPGY